MANRKTGPNRGGRVSKFSDAIASIIVKLAKEGKTDAEISKLIGISRQTLFTWRHRYPDFSKNLDHSKEYANELVEASLFQKATGYSHPETKVFYDSKTGETVEHTYEKYCPPETLAIIYWLNNRKPAEWRQRVESKIDIVQKPFILEKRDGTEIHMGHRPETKGDNDGEEE